MNNYLQLKEQILEVKARDKVISYTFAWINFSFTDIESAGLGLPIKSSCGLSDLNELHRQNIHEY
jgi:hypothetical protein